MRYYHQNKLFQVLLSAAQSATLTPDSALLTAYKDERLAQAVKALRTRNVFLYTEGSRLSVDLNSIVTIYTQPAGARLLIVAYSNNLRYGDTDQPTAALATSYPEMHRIRIVGEHERAIVEDLVPSQAGISCEPRWTITPLTVPVIIERQEQIAVDLGYDTAAGSNADAILPQAFIFFALKVNDKLTPQDYDVINDLQRYIANVDYQRGIFLNCESQPGPGVVFSSAIAGGTATCITRPANLPLLITAIGTSLRASRLTITDSADGHSFSLNRPMQSSALNMPDFENIGVPPVAPTSAPVFTEYWQLPFPHLLRSGAQLSADIVNGGDAGAGKGSVIDTQRNNILMFQGLTV